MDQDEEEGPQAVFADHQNTAGSTLLPSPVASVVSLVTRSSSLYLRLGTLIGGLALDGARVTTLTGLELSRALIEGILNRAGRDVAGRSGGALGKAEAEGILERSIGTLHTTITNISFAASTGFYFSAAMLGSATDLSQQLLTALDSILGSTDSSRAIASIVTLIRREFQNPATGQHGEKIGVADLLMGICGLALLQRWCKRLTDAEIREQRHEEVVWDVVVLDNGRRADVIGNAEDRPLARANSMAFMSTTGDEVLETIDRAGRRSSSEDDLPEISLKQRIMRSLPADASVSITTSTTTTKTITVEITGTQPLDLTPPPGVEIVEENPQVEEDVDLDGQVLTNEQKIGQLIPRYRVVYRIIKNRLIGTKIEARGPTEDAEDAIEVSDDEILPQNISKSPGLVVSPTTSPGAQDASPRPQKPRPSQPASDVPASHETADEKLGFSSIPVPKGTDRVANQKRTRKPLSAASSISGSEKEPPRKLSSGKSPASKKLKTERPAMKATKEKGSFRNALKKGSGTTLSNLWNKDPQPEPALPSNLNHLQRTLSGLPASAPKSTGFPLLIPKRGSSSIPARDAPRAPQRGNPNYFSSRDLGLMQPTVIPRSPSRASYYSIHERRRDSIVSQTDTYSIHSAETRPGSPSAFRTQLKAQSSLLRARSDKNIVNQSSSPAKNHRRSKSHAPSIYTLKTNNSATSLIVASQGRRSAFEDSETLKTLMRTGFVNGLFPRHHIVRNITHFVRFASASYGASFLRVMGITSTSSPASREIDTVHHHEHHSFSNHTQLPPDTILLSSFVDPQGGTDASGNTNTGVPMVHFVSLDHESKAVVLTCRGTLGFEDVLTDMTCDYDSMCYRGKSYSVHKGIHASAKRLLDGAGGRVLTTIKAALEEFSDYGLVMCGHSLGGGVTALLAIMISEQNPDPSSTSFITSASSYSSQLLLTASSSHQGTVPSNLRLPAGRPIHVYAYGPPATLSPSLRLATRGLITTVVNGQDIVPHLSLGVLHDLQAVALTFKTDDSGAKGEVRNRVWAGLRGAFADKWYTNRGEVAGGKEEDDQWAYSTLKALRASMLNAKLLPPGEVFILETMPVLQRSAFTQGGTADEDVGKGLGRPATRSVLRYVRDVEKRFGEVRFGGSMLLDHSPGRYEGSLGALRMGVLE